MNHLNTLILYLLFTQLASGQINIKTSLSELTFHRGVELSAEFKISNHITIEPSLLYSWQPKQTLFCQPGQVCPDLLTSVYRMRTLKPGIYVNVYPLNKAHKGLFFSPYVISNIELFRDDGYNDWYEYVHGFQPGTDKLYQVCLGIQTGYKFIFWDRVELSPALTFDTALHTEFGDSFSVVHGSIRVMAGYLFLKTKKLSSNTQ